VTENLKARHQESYI